jgi:DNA repair exonuclease SbcCD ATPase subunit
MSTDTLSTELQRFTPTEQKIAAMREQYMPLTIRDVNDTEGYKAVHAARMVVKADRVTVEKLRKDMKAEALEYGRRVDSEAKRITGLLEPIETHLTQQEDAYTAELDRIKNAARLKAEAELKAIADAAAAEIKAEQEAENARLSAERAELQRQREAMAAEQKKIDETRRAQEAEANRLAKIESDRLHVIEVEKARAESAEKARIETEQRIARETAAKEAAVKAKAEAEEAARIKAEALRPDREKLLAVASAVAAIPIPTVSPAATQAATRVMAILTQTIKDITQLVKDSL